MFLARKNRLAATRAGVVIDAADRDIAVEVYSSGDRFLQPEWVTADLSRHNTFRLKVPGQRERLVLPDILYIESLSVQIGRFDEVVVEQA